MSCEETNQIQGNYCLVLFRVVMNTTDTKRHNQSFTECTVPMALPVMADNPTQQPKRIETYRLSPTLSQ